MYIDRTCNPPVIRWERLDAVSGLTAAFSLREGGVSEPPYATLNLGLSTDDRPACVDENRRRFFAVAGVDRRRVAWGRQRHTTTILYPESPGLQSTGDALLTRGAGLAVAAVFADCLPLILAAPEARVAAVVHAGWRGTADGIARETVNTLQRRFGIPPGLLTGAVGPHIRRCCFEVQLDVARRFSGCAAPGRDSSHWWVDLCEANLRQLETAGVRRDHIDADAPCTCCNTDLFFSHRRDGLPSGRHLAVVAWQNT